VTPFSLGPQHVQIVRQPATKLGTYMRTAGSVLRADEALSVDDIQRRIRMSEGYTIDTMARLVAKGVATRTAEGWVRGPLWEDTRLFYGWKD